MIQNNDFLYERHAYRVIVSDHDRTHKSHCHSSGVTTREFSHSSYAVGEIAVIGSTFQTRKPACASDPNELTPSRNMTF